MFLPRIHPGNSSLHRGPLGRAAVVRQLLENLSWWQPDHRKNKTPHFNGTGLHRSRSTVDGYNLVGRLGWFSNTGQLFGISWMLVLLSPGLCPWRICRYHNYSRNFWQPKNRNPRLPTKQFLPHFLVLILPCGRARVALKKKTRVWGPCAWHTPSKYRWNPLKYWKIAVERHWKTCLFTQGTGVHTKHVKT